MRSIDADKLRKDVLDLPNCYNGFGDAYDKAMILDLVDEQPTVDAVPVVRCKDCKWCEMQLTHNGEIDRRYKQHFCNFFETDIELNFYCAAGERKDDE